MKLQVKMTPVRPKVGQITPQVVCGERRIHGLDMAVACASGWEAGVVDQLIRVRGSMAVWPGAPGWPETSPLPWKSVASPGKASIAKVGFNWCRDVFRSLCLSLHLDCSSSYSELHSDIDCEKGREVWTFNPKFNPLISPFTIHSCQHAHGPKTMHKHPFPDHREDHSSPAVGEETSFVVTPAANPMETCPTHPVQL